jgi:hypothetical protein
MLSTNELAIDMEIVKKRAYLPVKLAELSYMDQEAALRLLREWGAGAKPVSQLWEEAVAALGQQE